jgi:hypothetical protein
MSYISTINDVRYSRYETEADQIKSELTLNPEMILYKDRSRSYRMILSSSITDIRDQANKYFDYIPGSLDKYSLAGKELIIETIQL